MKAVQSVVGDGAGPGLHTGRTEGETWRASHRSRGTKFTPSWSILVAAIVGGGLFAGCAPDEQVDEEEQGLGQSSNQVIVDWIVLTQDVSGTNTPPRRSRTFAMVSVAMHDALNGIKPRYERYASSASDRRASPVAAAAQAAHDVLVTLFQLKQGDLDAQLQTSLGAIHDEEAKERGKALGKAAAADLLAKRASDGAGVAVGYTPILEPGFWRPTPPFFAAALEPNWGNVTPWGLESGSQFRSRAPYALTSPEYAADFNEVHDYGSKDSAVRSADQTSYAEFWFEQSAVGWNRLARAALDIRHQNLWQTARLFALMNMALADGYIASFDSKYTWQSWRPVTFIPEAESDGNSATAADPTWLPLKITPPIPDQTSAHTAAGFAARAALVEVFGDDPGRRLSMTSTTALPTDPKRSWATFTAAAKENGDSRVMAGIHTRQSVIDGETQGRLVGDYVVRHRLRPLDDDDD